MTDSFEIAKILVQCGAVAFRTEPPFQFTSGAMSPVYIDNRLLLGFVEARRELVKELAANTYATSFDAVAGTATAGIPWAAWLAEVLACPLLYVRSQAKSWGHEKSVEGKITPGWRVTVVEDLIYSGGSVRSTIDSLRANGLTVDSCVSIITYNTPASRSLDDIGIAVRSLATIDDALAAAVRFKKLDFSTRKAVEAWLDEIRVETDLGQHGDQ